MSTRPRIVHIAFVSFIEVPLKLHAYVLSIKLHFHLCGHDGDTNLYPDYSLVSFVSIYVVSIAIFKILKENLYATAYESVYGNGRIAA